jgi:hypothetical protein
VQQYTITTLKYTLIQVTNQYFCPLVAMS